LSLRVLCLRGWVLSLRMFYPEDVPSREDVLSLKDFFVSEDVVSEDVLCLNIFVFDYASSLRIYVSFLRIYVSSLRMLTLRMFCL
jgi:hypothetical protein